MSSNAAPSFLSLVMGGLAAGVLAASAESLAAQDDSAVTDSETVDEGQAEASPPAPPERVILDLSVTVPKDPSDTLVERDCEEENDAGRIANEIIVCRELGEASDGSFDKAEWEKRYAEKTKGISTPNTFGIPNHGNPIGFGAPPPPAYIVDFDALPETPAGSDADRIARGLPPLGDREELSEEEERARREALGVRTSTLSSAPQ